MAFETEAVIRHKCILIRINKLFRPGMTPLELYEATRGIWVIGPDREKADLVLSVYEGIVQEAYRIKRWYPSGTLPYKTRDDADFAYCDPPRYEFDGEVARDVRDLYVGRSVRSHFRRGNSNPIKYANP